MEFYIKLAGSHSEGHEGRARFDKIVQTATDMLNTNGFLVTGGYSNHDETPFGASPITADEVLDKMDAILDSVVSPESNDLNEFFDEAVAEQAATLSVPFASSPAAKLADEHNLTNADFATIEPSGANGFTKADVEFVIAQKEAQA
jgi:hypothetical protein